MNQVYIDIYKTVWGEVFPGVEAMEMETFKKLYIPGIKLPEKKECVISGQEIYSSPDYGYKRFISDSERMKRTEKDNFMEPKVSVGSLAEVLEKSKKIALFRGSTAFNSDAVEASDNIYSSSYVYNSASIHGAQKVMFSFDLAPCEYMLACRNSKNCSFCIRVVDSENVSNSFDVSNSGKCANCYFCHNCFDLRDCMFCFHIESKRFCIANMQFEESEYNTLKELLLKQYFEQLTGANPVVTQKDL
jgi:hypothetical protein